MVASSEMKTPTCLFDWCLKENSWLRAAVPLTWVSLHGGILLGRTAAADMPGSLPARALRTAILRRRATQPWF